MPVGWAPDLANVILNSLCNNAAVSILPVAEFWVQLHVGDPGVAGTANIAGNATRKQVSFGTATGGAVSNDVAVTWTPAEVDTSEDYTFWTGWTASTAGTFLKSGTVTATAVVTGNQGFLIPIGDIDLALTTAAT